MTDPAIAETPRRLYDDPMSFRLVALSLLSFALLDAEDSPRASTQIADFGTLPDRTAELIAALQEGNGSLALSAGIYRITAPLEIRLQQRRSAHVRSVDGPVTLVMDGPGPALRLIGSHEGTASPHTFEVATWNESFPLIEGIEILGNHPEADGIELIHCVQPTISRVAVRWCRHGIRIAERNRNVTLSDLHLYENSGIGVYLDDVNLHQINLANSHISYNREGGVVVRNGNVRNLQIANCDIEANMPGDDTPTTAANILIDVSNAADSPQISIAEIAITGCTIQHSSNYAGKGLTEVAPGGANIRILGNPGKPIDSVTIHGNIVSDTNVLVDLAHCIDINFTGNAFFAPNPDFFHVQDSKRIVLTGNTFNPRQFERPGRLRFLRSEDCLMTANTLRGLASPDHAILIRDCRNMSLNNNLLTESTAGVRIETSTAISVKDWTVSGLPEGIPFLSSDETSGVTD